MKFENLNYSVFPVDGYKSFDTSLAKMIKIEKLTYLILINCGGNLDLPQRLVVLQEKHPKLKIILLDSHRPYLLDNIKISDKIIIINDEKGKREEAKFLSKDDINFLNQFAEEISEEEDNGKEENYIVVNKKLSEQKEEEINGNADSQNPLEKKADDEVDGTSNQIKEPKENKKIKKLKSDKIDKKKRYLEICNLMS